MESNEANTKASLLLWLFMARDCISKTIKVIDKIEEMCHCEELPPGVEPDQLRTLILDALAGLEYGKKLEAECLNLLSELDVGNEKKLTLFN